jgi:hypothetical protein
MNLFVLIVVTINYLILEVEFRGFGQCGSQGSNIQIRKAGRPAASPELTCD